jgi:hypothetical protein
MERSGLLILTVDRVGTVDGFPPEVTALPIRGRPLPIQAEVDSWRLSS